MPGKLVRAYADTSVFGGVYDEEFETPSIAFFQEVREGRRTLVVSDIIRREIATALFAVQLLLDEMLSYAEVAPVTAEALRLRDTYLSRGILTPKWLDDALHVALATVSSCNVIVSWKVTTLFPFILHER